VSDNGVADWLREQSMILARNNNTPVSFWIDQPLANLLKWIRANNRIEQRLEEQRKRG